MGDLWPGWTTTTILFLLFFVAQNENLRWVQARVAGLSGANGMGLALAIAIYLSGWVALLFSIIWPLAYAFDAGWRHAAGLYVVAWCIVWAYSWVSTKVIASIKRARMNQPALQSDRPVLWLLGTLTVWPLLMMLTTRVSWFGWL